MTTIVTRTGKGSPLTHVEVDTNFTNLNTAKLEAGAIALGSAAAPSISFTGDTDTGVFSPGANQVAISTNGSGRLYVDASGNVGIASASDPGGIGSRLWIDNSTDTYYTINTTGSSNLTGIHFRNSNGNGEARILNNTGGALTFYRSPGNEAMRLDSSGRLGIGTTSPQALLNISTGSTAGDQTVLIGGLTAGGIAGSHALYLGAYGSTQYGCKIKANYNYSASVSTTLSFETSNAGTLTEAGRFDSSGRLLVGTSTANTSGAKLQTSDGVTFPATQVASADANTLDDYEEGTWTPTQEANLTVVGTFSSTGRYLKVGRQVFAEGVVTGSTSVAVLTTNAIAIGGLPFSSGYSRTPGLAGNEAISASATFQLVGTTLYFMQTMAATVNIRFVVTYSV